MKFSQFKSERRETNHWCKQVTQTAEAVALQLLKQNKGNIRQSKVTTANRCTGSTARSLKKSSKFKKKILTWRIVCVERGKVKEEESEGVSLARHLHQRGLWTLMETCRLVKASQEGPLMVWSQSTKRIRSWGKQVGWWHNMTHPPINHLAPTKDICDPRILASSITRPLRPSLCPSNSSSRNLTNMDPL